jgi:NAD(P)-dependent dehydrogenase (short-subunit alcohol dehydrogenase family)
MNREVAIVTGASSGIGAATAVELARRGYAVVLAARRAEKLQQVARQCLAAGGEALVVPTDVRRAEQVDALVASAAAKFGRLDVCVNNAGCGLHARVHETSDEQMRAIFDVNYFGAFYGCRAAARVMVRQRSGHIFNVSSVIGKRGVPFNGAYCATKFALCGLTDSLRVELRPYHVRVTAVCPALTDTEFFDAVQGRPDRGKPLYAKLRGLMPAEAVARKIVQTIGRKKPEILFTPGGRFLVVLSALWPGGADKLMLLYQKKLIEAEKGGP